MKRAHTFWDVVAPVYDLATLRGQEGARQAVAYTAERLTPADLLEEPERAVAELKRVVRPGGYIAVPCYVLTGSTRDTGHRPLWYHAGFSPAQRWQAEDLLSHLEHWGLHVENHRVFAAFRPLCVARCRNA